MMGHENVLMVGRMEANRIVCISAGAEKFELHEGFLVR